MLFSQQPEALIVDIVLQINANRLHDTTKSCSKQPKFERINSVSLSTIAPVLHRNWVRMIQVYRVPTLFEQLRKGP